MNPQFIIEFNYERLKVQLKQKSKRNIFYLILVQQRICLLKSINILSGLSKFLCSTPLNVVISGLQDLTLTPRSCYENLGDRIWKERER